MIDYCGPQLTLHQNVLFCESFMTLSERAVWIRMLIHEQDNLMILIVGRCSDNRLKIFISKSCVDEGSHVRTMVTRIRITATNVVAQRGMEACIVLSWKEVNFLYHTIPEISQRWTGKNHEHH